MNSLEQSESANRRSPASDCCACCSATRKAREAIAAFLASVTDESDNYVGGVERLYLEDALKECCEAFAKQSTHNTNLPVAEATMIGMANKILELEKRIHHLEKNEP